MKGPLWWTLLIVLFLAAVAARTGTLAVFVFVLALATAATELWGRFCLSNVGYRRRLGSGQIPYGEETSLVLEFTNAKPLPLAWLMVRDRFPRQMSLLAETRRPAPHRSSWLVTVLSLRWYERVTRTHRIRGDHRGWFQFGPAEVASGDAFGSRRRQRVDPEVDTLVVYPKVVPVHALGLPSARPMIDWFSHRRVLEDPLRFATVREYAPGDNRRYIHWKATARTGALRTKVFDPSDTLSLTIAVDVQTLRRAYELVPEYLEHVISAAASLATHALRERHMVGLCANGLARSGKRWIRVRPGRHPQQAQQILTALAGLSSFRGIPFEEMLYEVMPSLPFGTTVAAITARPREPTFEALASLEEAGRPTLLLTVGDLEADVPDQLTSYHLGGRDAWRRLEAVELA